METNAEKVPVIVRGMLVVKTIVDLKRPASVSDIINRTALPKPSVHRIIAQLEAEEYIQKEPIDKRRYIPGPKVRELAYNTIENESHHAPRHAVLEALSTQVNETCNLTVMYKNQILFFDRVETNWPIRIELPTGSKLPIHSTASGKLFLAYMRKSLLKQLLDVTLLQPYTDSTIIDREQLMQDLDNIYKQGYALCNEEHINGMVAIAVPVLRKRKNMLFSLSIQAPSVRHTPESLLDFKPHLQLAARTLSRLYEESSSESM